MGKKDKRGGNIIRKRPVQADCNDMQLLVTLTSTDSRMVKTYPFSLCVIQLVETCVNALLIISGKVTTLLVQVTVYLVAQRLIG